MSTNDPEETTTGGKKSDRPDHGLPASAEQQREHVTKSGSSAVVVVVVDVKSHSTSFDVFHIKPYHAQVQGKHFGTNAKSSIEIVCLVSVSSSVGKGQLDCWPPAKNSRDSKEKKAAAWKLEGLKDTEKTNLDLLVSRP